MAADRTVVLAGARGDRVTVTGAVIGPPDTPGEIVELGDATVIPGLVDAHVHFPSWALGLRELRLFGTRSVNEALERIEACEKPADGWLRGRGWREEDWPEGERPMLAALDEVTGEVPTALRAHDGHTLWVNSAALKLGGSPDHEDGLLREQEAWDFFDTFAAASAQETLDAVRAGIPVAHAAGVTGVHDKDGARGAPEAFAALREAGELTLRVWQSVPDADPDRGSYVKVFMDGTLGSRTALLLGGGGMRLMAPEGLAEVVRAAAEAGMPVAVHAIGDLANREALDGFEATEAVWRPLGLRHRVEHAQCIHADDIARYARLGITASVQYSHATSDRELAARLWADRLDRAYPYRQLLDAGVRLAGGSDAPVEELDPLAGIAAAQECGVTREEALESFTAAPAWLEGAEDRRGRLSPGCDADLVILDGDRVRATMVAGEWVHGQPRAS
jgi:predicted amidohydrolase YtcJ